MRRGLGYRIFLYFLSITFLSLMGGSPRWVADAKEKTLPVGEMVFRGGVKVERKENVWKPVEPSHFPVFPGVKIKTMADGVAAIALTNRCQVEVGQNTILSLIQRDQIHLLQGNINFRIPIGEEVFFRVGNLIVIKSPVFQASKRPASITGDEETIGSISVHSNGSVTVKNVQGKISVLSQDREVLASVPPKESVTIPAPSVVGKPQVMVAQVKEIAPLGGASTFLGVGTGTWLAISFAATALGVGIGVLAARTEGERVTCP